MKKRLHATLWLGVVIAGLILLSASNSTTEHANLDHKNLAIPQDQLQKKEFHILKTKCNVCHQRQNPFMIFREKNMSKRAKKIYQMVFLERKMPKGNDVRLSHEEYTALEKWLFTQEIF